MLTILAGVATWEREIMLERQREDSAKTPYSPVGNIGTRCRLYYRLVSRNKRDARRYGHEGVEEVVPQRRYELLSQLGDLALPKQRRFAGSETGAGIEMKGDQLGEQLETCR